MSKAMSIRPAISEEAILSDESVLPGFVLESVIRLLPDWNFYG